MKTLVLIEVDDNREGREWWEALGLAQEPARWNAFDYRYTTPVDGEAFVRLIHEREVGVIS